MSDQPPQPPPIPKPLPIVTMTIRLNQATGEMNISGPLHNRALAYGMLGLAFEIILGQGMEKDPAEGGRILVPGGRFGGS